MDQVHVCVTRSLRDATVPHPPFLLIGVWCANFVREEEDQRPGIFIWREKNHCPSISFFFRQLFFLRQLSKHKCRGEALRKKEQKKDTSESVSYVRFWAFSGPDYLWAAF